MKTLVAAKPPCNCYAKLDAHALKENLYLGSIVECDCGRRYKLSEDQRDGRYWAQHYTRDLG